MRWLLPIGRCFVVVIAASSSGGSANAASGVLEPEVQPRFARVVEDLTATGALGGARIVDVSIQRDRATIRIEQAPEQSSEIVLVERGQGGARHARWFDIRLGAETQLPEEVLLQVVRALDAAFPENPFRTTVAHAPTARDDHGVHGVHGYARVVVYAGLLVSLLAVTVWSLRRALAQQQAGE